MSLDEVQQKLHCRRCGRPRTVTRMSKPQADRVKLYMSCPVHSSEVVYQMPLSLYNEASGYIREHALLCRKCGQPVDITGQKSGKLTTTLSIQCPEHGQGDRIVNNSLLDPILGAAPSRAAVHASEVAPSPSTKFCASCGSPVPTSEARFCHHCGASLD